MIVSVIIPTHNRSATLGSAAKSVLTQSVGDLELLIIDDGSTEHVSPEFARTDSRVRVIRHPTRRGAQAARNTGLHAAQGHYVAFLDSDDVWLPGSLQLRLDQLERTGATVVHSECLVRRSDGLSPLGVPPLAGDVYRALLRQPGPTYPALLATREALLAIGGIDEGILAYQEWDTSLRLARDNQFAFVSAPTFIWNCTREDTISRDRVRGARGYEQIIRKHQQAIVEHAGRRALALHCRWLASEYCRARRLRTALRWELESLAWAPRLPKLAGLKHWTRLVLGV